MKTKINTIAKWTFDSHGINEAGTGRRLLKCSLARFDVKTQGENQEFNSVSVLASAAPDLLEAVKQALRCLDILDETKGIYQSGTMRAAGDMLRAAIAKAEGREGKTT